MEDLPFDLLEGKIIYYLQGKEILRLSMTNKKLCKRLYPIQIFSKCKIEPQCLWPILQTNLQKNFQYHSDIAQLGNCNWRFSQIDISIKTLLQIHHFLPRTDLLRVKVTNGSPSDYIELSSALINLKTQKIQLNGHFSNMEYLELFNNPKIIDLCVGISNNFELYDRSVALYKNYVSTSHLTKLSIMHNDLTDEFVAEMKTAISNSKIEYLNVSGNFIRDDGAKDLAEILEKSKIISIDLSYNPMTRVGIQAILSSLPHTKLKELYLGEHILEEESLSFESLANSQLVTFHLENELTIESQKSINKTISKTKIKDLALWIRTRLFNEFLEACANTSLQSVSFGFVFSEEDAYILSCNLPNLPFTWINIERSEIENDFPLFQSLTQSKITKITGFVVDFYTVRDLLPQTNLKYVEFYNILDDEICQVLQHSKIKTVAIKEQFNYSQAETMFTAYSKSTLTKLIIAVECDSRIIRLSKKFAKDITFVY
ncbi:hypothetical protein HDV06_003533 [Boothiomyces sp. JEL0866]|nr:hypothetical protein HDV06_003533 [Boothiomyces sp. JEL0866]